MWVWIPRFAYRVNSGTQNFDVVFLVGTTDQYYDENRELQTAKRCKSEDELVDTSTAYTVHPAFTDETNINYRNGGWDKEITGIWVAKFMAGYASGNNDAKVVASSVNYTQTQSYVYKVERGSDESGYELARNWLDGVYGETVTPIKYPVFQPLTYSMNYINHNDAYNIAKALTENGNIYGFTQSADSHLMKNSEWGAITYLSKSKYGIYNESMATTNVSLNSGSRARTETNGKSEMDSVYSVTGCTTGAIGTESVGKVTTIDKINSTSGNSASDGVYTWNQLNGVNLSSTGTIYGIYDLNGGLWERVSDYIANENEYLKIYGASISYEGNELKTLSNKYAKVYLYDSTTDNSDIEINNNTLSIAAKNNWNKSQLVYGDAIIETSTGQAGNYGWNNSYTHFLALNGCYMCRGAHWTAKNGGLFSYNKTNGTSYYSDGFRVTLIV